MVLADNDGIAQVYEQTNESCTHCCACQRNCLCINQHFKENDLKRLVSLCLKPALSLLVLLLPSIAALSFAGAATAEYCRFTADAKNGVVPFPVSSSDKGGSFGAADWLKWRIELMSQQNTDEFDT
jgi:hypothetical protein